MNMITRLIAALPRNATFPVIAILAGWYGGAKYGAPDYVMSSVDGMLAKGGDIVGVLLGGDKDDAPAQPADSEV